MKLHMRLILLTSMLLAAGRARNLTEDANAGLRSACTVWMDTVASHGGYVWEYSTDLTTRRRGESKDIPPSLVWVQAGTPIVGDALLDAYEATGDRLYLDGALAAGRCLAWGQLASGGWGYSIEFDLTRNRNRYHHLPADAKARNNTSTFDDDNTQSATRFLIRLDTFAANARIKGAVERALTAFLNAQYKEGGWAGAWPQRYPPPTKGYGRLPTYNDNTMSDCVRTMLLAYRTYGDPAYLESVNACLDFYLRSQFPAPQSTWAQQYGEDMEPAWARKFEPPSVCSAESRGNCRLLLDMYVEFGERRHLDAVGRAVAWFRASRIGGTGTSGRWARFYEVGTNRPLYFTRTYELTYDDSDLPVHYSFQSSYGVDSMIRRYEAVRDRDWEDLRREATATPDAQACAREAADLADSVTRVLDAMDEKGRWVRHVAATEKVRDAKGRVQIVKDTETTLPMIYTRDFVKNVRLLSRYLRAARGGPAAGPRPNVTQP